MTLNRSQPQLLRTLNVLIHTAITNGTIEYYSINCRLVTIDGRPGKWSISSNVDIRSWLIVDLFKPTEIVAEPHNYVIKFKLNYDYIDLMEDKVVYDQVFSFYKLRYKNNLTERLTNYIWNEII